MAELNIALIQKIRNVIAQEVLDAVVVNLRFGNGDPVDWKVGGQFRRHLSPKEAPPYC